MAVNKLMLTYAGADIVFLITGGLIIGFALSSESLLRSQPDIKNVAQDLLLGECPLTAGVVNACLVFFTFLLSLPVILLPSSKGWLRLQGWFVVLCAVFTLVLGLAMWFETLTTRANLVDVWAKQSADTQSLLQQKFDCCGYRNATSPPFVTDDTCPNDLVAIQKQGCVGPFSAFANSYLDLVFTAAFGVVGVDTVLLLCIVMVIKKRQELERYRHIDEKLGNY